MNKTSKKTVKRADNKSVSFRLTKGELNAVTQDLKHENQGRTPTTLTAYAKHALLEHHRLAAVEMRLIALHKQAKHVADNHAQDIVESVDGAQDNRAFEDYSKILQAIDSILRPEAM